LETPTPEVMGILGQGINLNLIAKNNRFPNWYKLILNCIIKEKLVYGKRCLHFDFGLSPWHNLFCDRLPGTPSDWQVISSLPAFTHQYFSAFIVEESIQSLQFISLNLELRSGTQV